jgi:hypothetical protein
VPRHAAIRVRHSNRANTALDSTTLDRAGSYSMSRSLANRVVCYPSIPSASPSSGHQASRKMNPSCSTEPVWPIYIYIYIYIMMQITY